MIYAYVNISCVDDMNIKEVIHVWKQWYDKMYKKKIRKVEN